MHTLPSRGPRLWSVPRAGHAGAQVPNIGKRFTNRYNRFRTFRMVRQPRPPLWPLLSAKLGDCGSQPVGANQASQEGEGAVTWPVTAYTGTGLRPSDRGSLRPPAIGSLAPPAPPVPCSSNPHRCICRVPCHTFMGWGYGFQSGWQEW